MSGQPQFDLRTEPWIPARFPAGEIRDLSLREVFAQAHEIRDLVGEVPTQVFAITRLLLAILHRALPETVRPAEEWGVLWTADTLPVEWIHSYLSDEDWGDRFDLLHPVKPFYQVASLSTSKGETSGLERLIADVPNGEQFFTTRRESGVESLSFAEAARWLVHAHAYDPSGIKSGATDDARVKGGKGYPIGTGWVGELGGILIEGGSLRETLLLNLVLGSSAHEPFVDNDLPLWERAPQTGAVESGESGEVRMPTGQVDLFTWQSRRIRLVNNGDRVTSVLITNGDKLRPQNMHDVEPMTAWRRSAAQEKSLGEPLVYMPRTHDPERSLWRGLAALIPRQAREVMTAGGAATLPPGNLNWLSTVRNRGALSVDYPIRTHAYGISYGTQSSTVEQIIDDALAMHLILLAEEGTALVVAAEDMVMVADQSVYALAQLAGNLEIAAGGQPDGARNRARERAYFELDPVFRPWLAGLTSSSVIDASKGNWMSSVRRIIGDLGNQLIDAAPPAAWIGRDRAVLRSVVHFSTSEASEWFRRALRKALALWFPDAKASGTESPREEAS